MELPSEEIHLYFCRSEALLADKHYLDSLIPMLDSEEISRWQRFIPEQKKREFLLAHGLLRWTLSQYGDLAPQDWRFQKNDHGKPALANPGFKDLCFNLSHTAGLQVVALTRGRELGVDVESRDKSVEGKAIAERFFSAAEVDELFSFPEPERGPRFFDYWSLKESYIKARGLGLAIPLDQFSFAIAKAQIGLEFAPELQDNADAWQFWLLDVGDAQSCAVGVKAQDQYQLRAWEAIPQQPPGALDLRVRQATGPAITAPLKR